MPWALLRLLDAALPSYRLWMLNAHRGIPAATGVRARDLVRRPGHAAQPAALLRPCPAVPGAALFATHAAAGRGAASTCRRRGTARWSMGTEVNVLPAAVEACRARGGLVVAQVNRPMPWTYGDGAADRGRHRPGDRGRRAAAGHAPASSRTTHPPRSVTWWPRGSTTAPPCSSGSAWCPTPPSRALADRRGLTVWSEMFSDGHPRPGPGRRAGPRAGADRASFLFGSRRALRLGRPQPAGRGAAHRAHQRPRRRSRPTAAMTSINTALQVDLFGQANASRINAPHPLRLRRPDRLHRGRPALRAAARR